MSLISYQLSIDDIEWQDIQAAKMLINGKVMHPIMCEVDLDHIKHNMAESLDNALCKAADDANFAIHMAYLDSMEGSK